jgi:recombinational DNA repair protein (RecF pathway)
MALALSNNKQSNQAVYVLHTYPFKETSLVVELFSQQFGRIAAVAKGARRPHSAMRGMLQSFQMLSGAWSGKNVAQPRLERRFKLAKRRGANVRLLHERAIIKAIAKRRRTRKLV